MIPAAGSVVHYFADEQSAPVVAMVKTVVLGPQVVNLAVDGEEQKHVVLESELNTGRRWAWPPTV